MQEKQHPPRRRLSRRASVSIALSVVLPALATAPAAYAATTSATSGPLTLSAPITTYNATVGTPFSDSLNKSVTGGSTPYMWSVPSIDYKSTSVVGSVYSGSNTHSSVTGQVYGVPSLLPVSSGSTVINNVYNHTTVTGNVYLLPNNVQAWTYGNLTGTPTVAGTISFEGVAMDKTGAMVKSGNVMLTVTPTTTTTTTPTTTTTTTTPTTTTTTPTTTTTTPTTTTTTPTTTTTTPTTTTTTTTTNPLGTQSFQTTVTTSVFSQTVTTLAISSTGGTVTGHTTNSSINVTVPSGAFSVSENVTINQAPVTSLQGGVPNGQTAVTAFGLNFGGATPAAPVTLSISNKGIPTSALVYQVQSNGMWTPIPAQVNKGRLSVSVTNAQDIVIANPQLPTTERQILWNGQREQVAHGFVAKDPASGVMTTYMPIWYLMQVLKQQGITSSWNGKVWNMTASGSSFTPNLTNVTAGKGTYQIEINGQLVQNAYGQIAVDPAHGNKTTYMPIYWVFQALGHLGLHNRWNGSSWSITTSASSTSSSTSSTSSTS